MKLTYLAPTTQRLSHTSLAPDKTYDEKRQANTAWRKWYKLKRWTDMRWQVLVDACFTCARCGKFEGKTSKLVADHRRPHRGNPDLFWDRQNLQCLCSECHDGAKRQEERATPPGDW